MTSILEEALSLVDGDRNRDYGTPLDNHTRTANLWNAYLAPVPGEQAGALTARDVCMLNILQKISRYRHKPKRDSLVDIAGYAENAQRCEMLANDLSPLPAAAPSNGAREGDGG